MRVFLFTGSLCVLVYTCKTGLNFSYHVMKFIWRVVQTLIAAIIAVALIAWWDQFQKMQYDLDVEYGGIKEIDTQSKIDTQQTEYSQNTNWNNWIMMMHDLESAIVAMVEKVSPSVVSIVANQDFEYSQWSIFGRSQPRVWTRELGWWSGFLVSREWYIITNRHVVDDTRLRYTIVFENGEVSAIESIWLDPSLDIAVIKVQQADLPNHIESLKSIDLWEKTSIGQFAFAIGNTLAEFKNSVTFGVISWRNRTIDIGLRNRYAGLYQTDTAISQWNSWWPLFNTDGEVIGVNTAVSAIGENIWFAIPITQEFIDATLKSIVEFDEIKRPFIGISYSDLDTVVAQEVWVEYTQWVYIQEVVQWSAADLAWLQAWDIIISLDSVYIDDENSLQYLLFTKLPDDILTLWVVRESQELTLPLKLWEQ